MRAGSLVLAIAFQSGEKFSLEEGWMGSVANTF
jgi:hypothetical protein